MPNIQIPHDRSLPLLLLFGAASLAGCGLGGEPPSIGSRASAVKVCAAGSTIEGVDVSTYQGNVNWASVAASGRQFAIARVSDGTAHPDAWFANNWAGIPAQGMVRGAYQYFRPGVDPIAQANLFLDALANDPIGPGDLPPVMDIETADGQSAATVRARMQIWLDAMTDGTGVTPMIYTAAFMSPTIGNGFGGYPLWVANWQTSCPTMPDGWSDWAVWQYASTGTVPGISGNVDHDQFNGTIDDLLYFTGAFAPPFGAGNGAPRPPAARGIDLAPALLAPLQTEQGSVMGDGARAFVRSLSAVPLVH